MGGDNEGLRGSIFVPLLLMINLVRRIEALDDIWWVTNVDQHGVDDWVESSNIDDIVMSKDE